MMPQCTKVNLASDNSLVLGNMSITMEISMKVTGIRAKSMVKESLPSIRAMSTRANSRET